MARASSGARILIKVEGGGPFGLGHVMRSIELAKTFEEMGAVIAGFLCNQDATSRARFSAANLPCETMETGTAGNLREAVDRAAADLLIIDQPTDLADAARLLRQERRGLCLGALDPPVTDLTVFDVIVSLFRRHVSMGPEPGGSRYFEGLEYAILRPEFSAFRSERGEEPPQTCDVLVSFGGTDPQRLTLKVLRALRGDLPNGLRVHAVIGPGFTFKEEVEKTAASASTHLTLHDAPQGIARLMASCDLGVVGGGTTALEMCCMGCPSLVIAQNATEVRFARHLNDQGVARYLGAAEDVSEGTIRMAVVALAEDVATRRQLGRRAQALIDGQGRRRTAAVLLRECAEREMTG